ncbi:MAG: hypothetical protein MZV70_06345 [Desulfobacterales bacterium]|nr:hypothetical protein [Desulfobacterales bacterium]
MDLDRFAAARGAGDHPELRTPGLPAALCTGSSLTCPIVDLIFNCGPESAAVIRSEGRYEARLVQGPIGKD